MYGWKVRSVLAKKLVLEERPTLKEELKKMSRLSFSELLWYIWQYYKFHIAVVIGVIALVVMIALAALNARKETLVSGIVLNISHYTPENPNYFQDTYFEYMDTDEKESVLDLRTDLTIQFEDNSGDLLSAYSRQVFTTLLSGNTEDFVICGEETIAYIQSSTGVIADLSEILSEQTYARLQEEGLIIETNSLEYHEDGTMSLGEDTFPAAVNISDSHLCRGLGIPEDINTYICFLSNSPTPEHFEEIITYLFDFTPSDDILSE